MTYDLDGNTLNDGTNSYVWDARNRLVSANSGGAAYAYDPLGRRILKTLLSSSTGFLYDGVNPVQELNGTTPTANLLTGGVDERFQRTDSTGTYSYLTDALGSTMALTDSTGAQQATYSYGPYGAMSITGSTTNSYGYTGRESDGLGIDYYRARYYNPQTGRFISEDPMGFRAGPNFYAYAGDDPIDFIDPFGMDRGPNGCGGNDGTSCNDPWLPYENQLPWDQQGPGGCGGSGSAGGSGGGSSPAPNSRTSFAVRGGIDLALSTVSLGASFSEGNWYGVYSSFFGMMSADEYLIGSITGNFEVAQAAAKWLDANSTLTGLTLEATGESEANAAQGSAAESAVTTFAGMGNVTSTAGMAGVSAGVGTTFESFADATMGLFRPGGTCP